MDEFLELSKKLEALDTEGMSRLLALDKAITGKRSPSKSKPHWKSNSFH